MWALMKLVLSIILYFNYNRIFILKQGWTVLLSVNRWQHMSVLRKLTVKVMWASVQTENI